MTLQSLRLIADKLRNLQVSRILLRHSIQFLILSDAQLPQLVSRKLVHSIPQFFPVSPSALPVITDIIVSSSAI